MQLSDRGFQRVILALVGVGFIALVAASAAAFVIAGRSNSFTRSVNHTYEVERRLSAFASLAERIETSKRGYLIAADPRFVDTLRGGQANASTTLDEIARLTRDNPRQQASLARLQALSARQSAIADRSTELVERGERGRAIAFFRTSDGANVTREIRALVGLMLDEENRLLAIRSANQSANTRASFLVSLAATVVVLLVAAGSIWALLRYTADLNRSRGELAQVNANLEATVAERTAGLQRANDEIQRFAYIVSHDLRSPLVNIMGFTSELDAAIKPLARLIDRAEQTAPGIVDEDARLTVKEELPVSIKFIRSSTQKMDRLINAILQLSREGRRKLTTEPVDVAAVVDGVRDSLQHRLGESGAEIAIETPLPPVVSDRLAIEQILSNLIENAVKYASPDQPARIVVSGRADRDGVIYDVADNGRGVDPKDHERIFDLFRRSGAQDQPGEGIGLAHVRALAYRLGGTIGVASALGRGSTFSLSLPKSFSTN